MANTQQGEEKIFADGFSFKRNDKAPEFVIGRMSVKVEDAIAFLQEHEDNGWVNLNVKQARSGNYYVELDTFKPEGGQQKPAPKKSAAPAKKTVAKKKDDEGVSDDLPF